MKKPDFLTPLPVLERVTPDLRADLETWTAGLDQNLRWELSVVFSSSDHPYLAMIHALARDASRLRAEVFPRVVRVIVTPATIAWQGKDRARLIIENRTRLCLVGDKRYTLFDEIPSPAVAESAPNNVLVFTRKAS